MIVCEAIIFCLKTFLNLMTFFVKVDTINLVM